MYRHAGAKQSSPPHSSIHLMAQGDVCDTQEHDVELDGDGGSRAESDCSGDQSEGEVEGEGEEDA